MKKLILLSSDWEYGGAKFIAGQKLNVDSALAETLITDGKASMYVEAVTKATSDPPAVEQAPDDASDKNASHKSELDAANARMSEMEAVIRKMATTPATEMKAGVIDPERTGKATVVKTMWEDDPSLGYGSLEDNGPWGPGDFLLDVMYNQKKAFPTLIREKHFRETQKHMLEKCRNRPVIDSVKGISFKAVGSDEHSTAEMAHGGVFVPVEYRTDVITKDVVPEIARANGAVVIPVTGSSVIFPITKDFDRSGGLISGVTVFRDHERVAAISTRAEFAQFQLTPQRITGAGHITGYLLAQAPQIGGIILGEMQKAFTQKMNREHIKGDGGGEAKGALNQTGAYSQSRTTSSRIEPVDITDMWARQFNPSNGVWLASQSSFSEIMLMTKTIGTAGALVVMPNISDGPMLLIMGRPLIFNEFSPSLGSKGDLMFVDWSQYMIAESSYRKQDRTMFVRYLEDQDTFRLIAYNHANSHWPSTIKNDSGFEQSPFVILAA